MKVVAFNGSARKEGNTSILIRTVLERLEKSSIDTELIDLAGKVLRGCTACALCRKNADGRCAVTDDAMNDYIQKMRNAQGIILGSPVYFTDVTAEMKALIDRAGYVARGNDHFFKRKIGAAVVAVRRAGSLHTFDTLNHFFTISQMIVPGSDYWNMGLGGKKGDVASDEEGLNTMRILGDNMAWLMEKCFG
jgi:multimeric flavodoxin WrbA